MGRARTCGKICHNAKREQCGCWCRGLFHGVKGAAARDAFVSSFGEAPKQERGDLEGFQDGMRRACQVAGVAYVQKTGETVPLPGIHSDERQQSFSGFPTAALTERKTL